jgi:hypothetical protein
MAQPRRPNEHVRASGSGSSQGGGGSPPLAVFLVELTVDHKATDLPELRAALEAEFGAHNDAALNRSALGPGGIDYVRPITVIATEALQYRLLITQDGRTRLNVRIEDIGQASVLSQCVSLWRRIKKALKAYSAKLRQVVAKLSTRSRELMIGRIGVLQHLRQDALVLPALTLVAASLFIVIARQTFAANTWQSMLLAPLVTGVSVLYFGYRFIRRGMTGDIYWEARGE